MKQHSLGLGMTAKRTRRREFLGEMEKVVRCPSNFVFHAVALMPPWIAEQHAC
jgi:IS5 family transposase